MHSQTVVTSADIRQNLTLPILNQIHLDAGEPVSGLAERRLAVETPAFSVRQESERLGVTRARVYQLLDTCSAIMNVRWPAGRWALQGFIDQLRMRQPDADVTPIVAVCNLCYPDPEFADDLIATEETIHPEDGSSSRIGSSAEAQSSSNEPGSDSDPSSEASRYADAWPPRTP
jgi:hypothetical protein